MSKNKKKTRKKLWKKAKEKGITLIALVITIIVLLILAGVTIATLTGENGVLTKVSEASEETTLANEKEMIKLAYSAVKANNIQDTVTGEKLQKELDKIVGDNEATCTDDASNNSINVVFEDSKNEYTINSNGEISYQKPIDYPTFATETTGADYGKYVNYNVDYDNDDDVSDDWRIFYNDGSHIYLISSDYVVPEAYASAVGGYRSLNLYQLGYTTTDSAIEFLSNTENWKMLKDDTVAKYVTGATTLEMYVASWNQNHDEKIYLANGGNGLLIGNTENPSNTSFSFSTSPEDLYYVSTGTMPDRITNNMWIASKMDNGNIVRGGYNINSYESNTAGMISGNSGYLYCGIRPVVCLKEEVILNEGDGSLENPFIISVK